MVRQAGVGPFHHRRRKARNGTRQARPVSKKLSVIRLMILPLRPTIRLPRHGIPSRSDSRMQSLRDNKSTCAGGGARHRQPVFGIKVLPAWYLRATDRRNAVGVPNPTSLRLRPMLNRFFGAIMAIFQDATSGSPQRIAGRPCGDRSHNAGHSI